MHLVTRSINDLYFTLSVRELTIEPWSLAKGAALGLLATLAAAWLPARGSRRRTAGCGAEPCSSRNRWRAALPRLLLAGLGLLAGGGLALAVSHSLTAGFAGLFLLILGCALLTPPAMVGLVQLKPTADRPTGVAGADGQSRCRPPSEPHRHRGRGADGRFLHHGWGRVMVDSFRGGVAIWIGDLLNADLYVASPAVEDGGDHSDVLTPAALAVLRDTPGVAAISTYRALKIELERRPVTLLAVELAPASQTGYHLIAGDEDTAWRLFKPARRC